MFSFDPISLSAAYFMTVGAVQCPALLPRNVAVDVHVDYKRDPYIVNLSSAELTTFAKDADSTISTDGHWMVGGLTKSGFDSEIRVDFIASTFGRVSCLNVEKVTYTIKYNPQVYIASDYLNMGCRYSVTVMHEEHHVDTDRRLLDQYIPGLKQTVKAYAEQLGPQGPYPTADIEMQKNRIVRIIGDGLQPLMQQLATIRRQRQAQIDTKANYMRETAMCPDQFPKFEESR
jgi:hypothetical protein